MNRIAILAAVAAFAAAPAFAQSVRVSTVGKSPEQIRAEVYKAAQSLCALEIVGASFPVDEMRACIASTVRTTIAQAPDLKLARR